MKEVAPIARLPLSELARQQSLTSLQLLQKRKSSVYTGVESSTPRPIRESISEDEFQDGMLSRSSTKEKLVYASKNGTDTWTLEFFEQIEEENEKFNFKSINDSDSSGATLLHLCAQRNKPLCVDWLLNHGLQVDVTDKAGATPLMYAAAHDSLEVLAILVSSGANVNAKDLYNRFPLYICMKGGHFKAADMLVQIRGLDVHNRGPKGNTVLHSMALDGNIHAVQYLIDQAKASPLRRNYDEATVLQCGLQHTHITNFICKAVSQKDLIKLITSVDIYGMNAIHSCSKHGYIQSLISIFTNCDFSQCSASQINSMLNSPDKTGDTPLLLGVKNKHPSIVSLLCQCDDVYLNEADYRNNTALYYAVSSKNEDIILPLTLAKASLTPDDHTDSTHSDLYISKTNCCTGCATSLKTLLVFILSAVCIICIGAVTGISLGFFSDTIKRSTTLIRNNLFLEALTFMNSSTSELSSAGRTTFAQLNSRFNLSDIEHVKDLTWGLFSSNKQYSQLLLAAYCGKIDGGLAAFVHLSDSNSVIFLENYIDVTKQNVYNVEMDFSNRRPNITSLETTYNTTQQQAQLDPMYIATRNANESFWSKSYTAAGTAGGIGSFLFLTYAHPIKDEVSNEWLGFCAVDTSTESLNEFLVDHALDGSVTVVIERATGYLIGTSDPEVPLYKTGDSNDSPTIRYSGTDGTNPLMTSMLNFATSKYGGRNFSAIGKQQLHYDTMKFSGRKYFVNIGSIADDAQLDWVIVQAIPYKLFYSRFNTTLIIISLFGLGLLILNIILAVIVAEMFMRPLKKIMNQAENIKLLQLEKVEREIENGLAVFSEIRSLQSSFHSMTKRLKQFRSFIPDHILSVIENEASGTNVIFRKSADEKSLLESKSKYYMGRKGIIQHALTSSELRSEYVTVMNVEVTNLSQILDLHSSQDVATVTQEYIHQMKECIHHSNGQIVFMTSTTACIIWNCLAPQVEHEIKACTTALTLIENIRTCMKDLPYCIDMNIAISSGAVYSGNLSTDNTDKSRMFSVIGRPMDRVRKVSNIMHQTQQTRGCCVMVSEDIFIASQVGFYFKQVSSIADDYDQYKVYELLRKKSEDEWVNELSVDTTKKQSSISRIEIEA